MPPKTAFLPQNQFANSILLEEEPLQALGWRRKKRASTPPNATLSG